MPDRLICPGCSGKKTRRAQLCHLCRPRANSVGGRVWSETAQPAVQSIPRTPQQNRVYHARCASIAKLEQRPLLDVKRTALEHFATRIGRPLESSTELSEIEMELLLESLDQRLFELGYTYTPAA